MLVLTRKVGEKVLIGDNVIVTVVEVRGNRVRVSIEAPREVCIRRGELEKRQAIWLNPPADEPAIV